MLTLAEKREAAAAKVREANELLKAHPEEVPKEVADQVSSLMQEYEGLTKEIGEAQKTDDMRTSVTKAVDDQFKPTPPKTQRPTCRHTNLPALPNFAITCTNS